MSTMRRDILRRLVEAGRVELVSSYHYDDQQGSSQHKGAALPVEIMPEDRHACQEGICYLYPSDLTSSSGSATQDAAGNISLYVHSNCQYALHIKNLYPSDLTSVLILSPPGLRRDPPQGGSLKGVHSNCTYELYIKEAVETICPGGRGLKLHATVSSTP